MIYEFHCEKWTFLSLLVIVAPQTTRLVQKATKKTEQTAWADDQATNVAEQTLKANQMGANQAIKIVETSLEAANQLSSFARARRMIRMPKL